MKSLGKRRFILIVLSITFCLFATSILSLWLYTPDTENPTTNEDIITEETTTDTGSQTDELITNTISPKKSTSNIPTAFSRLSDDEIEEYYKKGEERFSVFYFNSTNTTQEEFKQTILPFIKVYIAYTEYQFERMGDILRTANSEELDTLSIRVYETWELYDPSGQAEYRYIGGSASAFTYGTKLFIGHEDPDFQLDSLIHVATHEAIHLMQYTYCTECTAAILPSWYKEGMAESLAFLPSRLRRTYPELFTGNYYPDTLYDLEQNFKGENLDTLRTSYAIAVEFYTYLANDYKNIKNTVQMLTAVKYADFYKIFEEIFNQTPEEAYQEFLQAKI